MCVPAPNGFKGKALQHAPKAVIICGAFEFCFLTPFMNFS